MNKLRTLASLLVCMCLPIAREASAQGYSVTELPTLPGGNFTQANGITDSGDVFGITGRSSVSGGSEQAFLYSHGTITGLGTLGGFSQAWGANNRGEVVGLSTTASSGAPEAFLYQNGKMTGIQPQSSWAFGINDAGAVVGFNTPSGTAQTFLYQNGVTTALVPPGGSPGGGATGINNRGQVIGTAVFPNGNNGFLYQHGVWTNLGMLVNGPFNFVSPADISDNGHIVGYTDNVDFINNTVGPAIAFLDNQALGTLGGAQSFANAVNDEGEVVGNAETSSGGDDAFLYRNGQMINLNSLINPNLGIELINATGINDEGWIVANAEVTNTSGSLANGFSGAVLLKPLGVPEPGTLALFALALAGLAVTRKRWA